MNRIALRLKQAAVQDVPLDTVPENVIKAATLALGQAPTSAGDVGTGIMFGTKHSYEDDNWVLINYTDDNITSVIKNNPMSDDSDVDITNEILSKLENETTE